MTCRREVFRLVERIASDIVHQRGTIFPHKGNTQLSVGGSVWRQGYSGKFRQRIRKLFSAAVHLHRDLAILLYHALGQFAAETVCDGTRISRNFGQKRFPRNESWTQCRSGIRRRLRTGLRILRQRLERHVRNFDFSRELLHEYRDRIASIQRIEHVDFGFELVPICRWLYLFYAARQPPFRIYHDNSESARTEFLCPHPRRNPVPSALHQRKIVLAQGCSLELAPRRIRKPDARNAPRPSRRKARHDLESSVRIGTAPIRWHFHLIGLKPAVQNQVVAIGDGNQTGDKRQRYEFHECSPMHFI